MTYPNSPVTSPEEQPVPEQDSGAPQENPQESSFGEILSQFEQEHHSDFKGGETLQGTVVTKSADNLYINVGRKMEGLLPIAKAHEAGLEDIKPGDTVPVLVTGRDEEGYYLLSTIKVDRPRDWSALEQAFTEKRTIAGRVIEVVKGGLRVDVGARAFMPASRSGAKDQAELEKLVDQEIQCRITKLDTAKEDVVVDRRVVLEEEAAKLKNERFGQLHEGDVVQGCVRTLTEFGAFVDIGGFDGLLHVQDMSWARTAKPADIVSPGQQIEVKILKINRESHKIALGLKQLQPDPWSAAPEKYKVGERVTGTVSRLTDFGAFVELEPGVDGLIHLSEMSWSKKVRKPSDVVKPGERVEAVVLNVNAAEHRIALGLKQALGDPWDEVTNKYPVGATVEGVVVSLQKFGAFIDLGGGVEGMIHIGDISNEKRLNHPNEVLKPGETVKAQVLDVDKDKRRIRLGMKQLQPTSADEFIAEHKTGDMVSGRLMDVSVGRARVELGEGVHAICRTKEAASTAAKPQANSAKADVSTMSALLTAKWKTGGTAAAQETGPEPLRPGQIRTFRITLLDPAQKKIEVELA
jgi:small subunit ribosomal protein S1